MNKNISNNFFLVSENEEPNIQKPNTQSNSNSSKNSTTSDANTISLRAATPNRCNDDEKIPNSKTAEQLNEPPPPPPPPPPALPTSQPIRLKTKPVTQCLQKQDAITSEFEQREVQGTKTFEKSINSNVESYERAKSSTDSQSQLTTQHVGNINRERRVSEIFASASVGKCNENYDVKTESTYTLNRKQKPEQRQPKRSPAFEKDDQWSETERNVCMSIKKPPSMFSTGFEVGFSGKLVKPDNREANMPTDTRRDPSSTYCVKSETDCTFCGGIETRSSGTKAQEPRRYDSGECFQKQELSRGKTSASSSRIENDTNSELSIHNQRRFLSNSTGHRNSPGLDDSTPNHAEIVIHRRRNGPWDHLLAKTMQTNNFNTDTSSTQICTDDEISHSSRYRTRWKTQEVQSLFDSSSSVYRPRSPAVIHEENQSNAGTVDMPPPGRVAARVSAMENVEPTAVRYRNFNAATASNTIRRRTEAQIAQFREWRPHSVVETRNTVPDLLLPKITQKRRSVTKHEGYSSSVFDVPNTDSAPQIKSRQKVTKFTIDAGLEHTQDKKEQQMARPLSMWCGTGTNKYVAGPYGRHVTETPYGRNSTTDCSDLSDSSMNQRAYHYKWRSSCDAPPVNYGKNASYVPHVLVNEFRPLPPPPPPTRYSSVHVRTS